MLSTSGGGPGRVCMGERGDFFRLNSWMLSTSDGVGGGLGGGGGGVMSGSWACSLVTHRSTHILTVHFKTIDA